MNITVLGASGKTGRGVVERLLAAGVKVKAVARSAEKLATLAKAGAEVVTADVSKPDELARALEGADAAYALIPPNFTAPDLPSFQDAIIDALGAAITSTGIKRVVLLSSLGAERESGTGLILGPHRAERRLRAIAGLNLISLRAGYFFENFYNSLSRIKHQGINTGVIAPHVPLAMIASRDISEAAASALLAETAGHETRELLGPRDLTMVEATRILGRALGRPELQYLQLSPAEFAAGLKAAGVSPSAAGAWVETAHAYSERRAQPLEGRTPRNTTPTTFESFVPTLASAYLAAS